MFDIGWSEVLVIAVVAIIVVGPKDLPRMLRAFGKTMGQVRRTANDFKRQFDDALREAEREADLADTRKTLQSIGNPLADVKRDLDKTMRSATASATGPAAVTPTPAQPTTLPPSPAPPTSAPAAAAPPPPDNSMAERQPGSDAA